MNSWAIFQLLMNISIVAVGVAFYLRSKRPKKDDPRLSKGLQLLQSKIAILEDLSDRVDNQVKQLTQILDQKAKMTHEYSEKIQTHLNQVEQSIQKSIEVSQIFQDKIPHKEIIERQNTVKYIQAARMANQGLSYEEISSKVDIPKSELEFIIKVNREKLMFSEEKLPSWALSTLDYKNNLNLENESQHTRDYSNAYESLKIDNSILEQDQKIKSEFKQALKDQETLEQESVQSIENIKSAIFDTFQSKPVQNVIQTIKNIPGQVQTKFNSHSNTADDKEIDSVESAQQELDSQNQIVQSYMNVLNEEEVSKEERAEETQTYSNPISLDQATTQSEIIELEINENLDSQPAETPVSTFIPAKFESETLKETDTSSEYMNSSLKKSENRSAQQIQEPAFVQKIGSYVEKKLGFEKSDEQKQSKNDSSKVVLESSLRRPSTTAKTNFSIKNSTPVQTSLDKAKSLTAKSITKESLSSKKSLSQDNGKKVRPFVFKKLDGDL